MSIVKPYIPGIPSELAERLETSDSETDDLKRRSISLHEPVITPVGSEPRPGRGPSIELIGTVLGLEYDNANDEAYRDLKIPDTYVGDAAFHVHWTKAGNANEQGNSIRWRLRYTVYNGSTDNVALVTPTELIWDDVYEDSGTTTRIVHRTNDLEAPGFIAGYYVGAVLDYIDEETTLSSNPIAISVDFTWTGRIN